MNCVSCLLWGQRDYAGLLLGPPCQARSSRRNSHHSLLCTLCSCSVKLFLSFPFADAGPPAWLAFRRPFPDQLHQPFKAQVCYLTGSYPVGNARPLGSSTSYLHLCGCAWFCTWFCLSFYKFPEDTGHTLSCKAQCLAVVCVQQKQSLSSKSFPSHQR